MGRLIDTSIFIEAERGRLDTEIFGQRHKDDAFFMSVITVSELLHGVHRASPKYFKQRSVTIEKWIDAFPVIDIDIQIAREHARLYSQLRSEGQLIGVHDQWLAATCLSLGLIMVTGNAREFDRVPGLNVETLA